MSEIWFTAAKRFDSTLGDEWKRYYEWVKIPQLREVISIDSTHRPEELQHLIDADWEYNIHQNYRIAFFRDTDYLLKRFSGKLNQVNILAVMLEPSLDVRESLKDNRFSFQGYDLAGQGDVSAITNCGGFDDVFVAADISEVGLFDSFAFARRVQKLLLETYPDEYHADCELWAIWKMVS